MSSSCLRFLCRAVVLVAAISFVSSDTKATERMDVLIQGGRVVDGSGAPWFVADIGVRDGKIAAIGKLDRSNARTVIDAKGFVVTPGFIDMMGQTASPMLENPSSAMNLLTQGITTINAGEGYSAAPLNEEEGVRYGWPTMAEYFQILELKGMPVNVVQTVGHTQVRRIVMGEEDRRPTPEETSKMQALVREGMQAGAIGVSTALIYPPAVYANTEEISALASVAGAYGGRYYTHMRNEGDQLLEAIDEALAIGEQAGTPVHIFHLKAAGRQNWGKMPLAIARIKAARAAGKQVTADIYPYQHNGLGIEALIHPRHFSRGRDKLKTDLGKEELRAEIRQEMETTDGWENWFRHVGKDWNNVVVGTTTARRYRGDRGKSVADIADSHKEDAWETFFTLAAADTFVMTKSMTDANKLLAMQQEFVSFCTDVGPASRSRISSHPRAFGAFPRLFSRYVRDLGVISLERAVSQASAAAANDIMAYDRGRLAVGLAADIVVMDYENVKDNATPAEPRKRSQGVKHVLVNGTLVLKDGRFTRARPGRVLRGPGYDRNKASHLVKTGKPIRQLAALDEAVQSVMKQHRVPGASLAVTDQGRLVYARGFGYADVAAREQVQPTSLFRIASISKPITAVAIMQLVEQGKLSLDDKVFSILTDYKPVPGEEDNRDPRLDDITIEHLLQHRGGWDRGVSFDAMFKPVEFANALKVDPPAGQTEIIRNMLGIKLDFTPGERFAYSNFGYCLLGRVVEKLTGQNYEQYAKQHVLDPMGAKRMVIGGSRVPQRKKDEVRYYSPLVSRSVFAADLGQRANPPYGPFYVEPMDSHGGWIASSIDLVRFISAFDKPEEERLLKKETFERMTVRPAGLAGHDKNGKPKSNYYALSWSVDVDSEGHILRMGHSGSLYGTSTMLCRRSDGRNFAILFNSRRSPTTGHLSREVVDQLHAAIDRVKAWPTKDQFSSHP